MRAYWNRVRPWSNITDVFINKGNLDTDSHTGRETCDNEGRDQNDAYTRQRTPKNVSKTPKARREAWNCSQKEATLLRPWTWTSSLQNCKKLNLLFKPLSLCCSILAAWADWHTHVPRLLCASLLWAFKLEIPALCPWELKVTIHVLCFVYWWGKS